MPVKTFGCQPTRKLSLPIGGDDNCALMITQIKTIVDVSMINRVIIVIIYNDHTNQDNHEWSDQQNDHRDNILGDGANRRGSCKCGDDGYHDQHFTRGDFKT